MHMFFLLMTWFDTLWFDTVFKCMQQILTQFYGVHCPNKATNWTRHHTGKSEIMMWCCLLYNRYVWRVSNYCHIGWFRQIVSLILTMRLKLRYLTIISNFGTYGGLILEPYWRICWRRSGTSIYSAGNNAACFSSAILLGCCGYDIQSYCINPDAKILFLKYHKHFS